MSIFIIQMFFNFFRNFKDQMTEIESDAETVVNFDMAEQAGLGNLSTKTDSETGFSAQN